MNRIYLIIIVLITLSCKAQSNIIDIVKRCNNPNYDDTNGSVYLKDVSNLYSPYMGTWKWEEGNKVMILTLIKQTKYHVNAYANNNYYEDRLVGYYTYKENGTTLIDTSGENLLQDYLNVNFSILCDGTISCSIFQDVYRGTNYDVTLEMLSPTQMKFTGKMGEGTYPRPRNGTITYLSGTTFPLEMTFIKQ